MDPDPTPDPIRLNTTNGRILTIAPTVMHAF